MLLVIPHWIDWTAPVAVYLFAAAKGSAPERIVAAVGGAGWLYGNVLRPHWYGQMLPTELAKDMVLLVVITWLALRYDRWWLLAAGSMALLHVATDVAGMLSPVHPWAFGTAMWTWNWIFLGALAAGTWANWRGRQAPAIQAAQAR
jgi:hypothetical protein